MESQALDTLARRLVRAYFPELAAEKALTVHFAWKRLGGASGGNSILGKCVPVKGLTKHFAGDVDFVIWLAADHCADFGFDDRQVEALVFHELMHIEVLEEGNYRTRGHDCELFISELERYGAWKPGMQALIDAARRVSERARERA